MKTTCSVNSLIKYRQGKLLIIFKYVTSNPRKHGHLKLDYEWWRWWWRLLGFDFDINHIDISNIALFVGFQHNLINVFHTTRIKLARLNFGVVRIKLTKHFKIYLHIYHVYIIYHIYLNFCSFVNTIFWISQCIIISNRTYIYQRF